MYILSYSDLIAKHLSVDYFCERIRLEQKIHLSPNYWYRTNTGQLCKSAKCLVLTKPTARLFYIYICVSAHSKAYIPDPVRAPNQVDIFQAQEFMVRSLWLPVLKCRDRRCWYSGQLHCFHRWYSGLAHVFRTTMYRRWGVLPHGALMWFIQLALNPNFLDLEQSKQVRWRKG